MREPGFFTFVHHEGPLIEWSDDITERIIYIETQKPVHERATRLRCLTRIPEDRLPALYAAGAEYQRVKQLAEAEYERVKQPAGAEYQRVRQLAEAEYQRVRRPAWAEYQRVRQPAWDEYQRVRRQVLTDPSTLALVKALIPDCPWDGHTIFPKE